MITLTLIIGIICLVVMSFFYGIYTKMIKTKNNVKQAMSGIDVQLNKRYDLIPNILTIANKFMEHERELITKITELRAKATGIQSNSDTIK